LGGGVGGGGEGEGVGGAGGVIVWWIEAPRRSGRFPACGVLLAVLMCLVSGSIYGSEARTRTERDQSPATGPSRRLLRSSRALLKGGPFQCLRADFIRINFNEESRPITQQETG